ncbi:MAG: substrate-binding domain-containing protein [Anaerolineaceae bacterium]|nr:substrate-binding domain-containing protein [Anaerolineaceae bacterium]
MATATLRDVAKFANVSEATVSRVLNNHASVNEVLRERVNHAIEILNYQPNRAARRLRSPSSSVIGLIISDIENPFFLSLIRGLEDAAYAQKMNVILCNSDEDLKKQARYLDVMTAERVAGLILVPSPGTKATTLRSLLQTGIPFTLLDRFVDGVDADVAKVDNIGGAYNAVKHAAELGYSRIGAVINSGNISTGVERYEGYVKALGNANIPLDSNIVKYGDFSVESAFKATQELISQPNPVEAIFAANNLMSLGVLRALRDVGKRVPEDVALIGFDDMPWLSEFSPPLTAVAQPSYELGQEAIHLLLRRIAQPSAPTRTVTLQTRLIIRQSCGVQLRRNKGS